jgi:1,5-anhydro-D-fructose reductase (1,5-anhydro-D-mannitol-forming)
MTRFGILGFGLHAVRRLMPGFAQAKRCVVTGLSRRDIGRARQSAQEFGIPHAFDSAEDLCRSSEVDAVFVTTPNCCHLQDVLLALKHGKPALCEKPMGMNADECRQMVDAAKQAGLLLGVAQVFRFEDSTANFRDRVARGEIGRPVFARSEFSYPGRSHPRRWLTDMKLAGGGPIADVGVHCIDALRYILQDEVVEVVARGFSDRDSGDVEAAATLVLKFSRGTLGTVMVSIRSEYRTPLEVIGEEAALRAMDALNVEHSIQVQLVKGGDVVNRQEVSNTQAYARQVDAFSAALEDGTPFPVPGEEGWKNQVILDAAYRSLNNGTAEKISIATLR